MYASFKPLVLAGLLAAASMTTLAQTPGGGMMHQGMGAGNMESMHGKGHMDLAKMQARYDKRLVHLKTLLKLTPAQEGSWTTFVAAVKPTGEMMAKRPDHAELAKLPTPQRIDKMKELHAEHVKDMTAMMDKRGEATKAFYATLTPDQQKVFDANALPHHEGRGKGGKAGKPPVAPKP